MAADPARGPGDGGSAAGRSAAGRSAAFFDLDRTLMEGSSAFQFGRAAYRAGLLSRRQLMSDGWANLKFRLRGATDEDSHALRDRISRSLEGHPGPRYQRLGADVLAGVLPRIYPQVLELAHGHQDDGRRVYIVTAASQDLAEMLARVLALRRRDRLTVLRGQSTASTRAVPPGCSSTAAARRGRSRSSLSARASTWRVPTPTRTRPRTCRCSAVGRPPGGGQPRRGARQGGARGGLGRAAL